MSSEKLRYPIGKASIPAEITDVQVKEWIDSIEDLPGRLQKLVSGLDEEQLDTPYRDGGWTIKQVLHHLFDSHVNSYIRFKWALTEDEPLIKAYFEERWADLGDSFEGSVDLALNGLSALHDKWTFLLRSLKPEELDRCFIHPEGNKKVALKENIGIYAWHGNHHYAHIEELLKRKGWISI